MNTKDKLVLTQPDWQRRRLLTVGTGVIAATLLPGAARAQAWPSKPIRIIAAQAPGASNDQTARAFADYFSTHLGVPVVVENRPGGIGMIAATAVARSAPDGYTFLLTLHSQLAQAPVLLKNPPIDPSRDLVPIASISTGTSPMVVKKDLPVNNLKELIELARKRPVSVGNYGVGSSWQMMVIQMAKQTGGQFDIINYKGTGPMLMDLIAGHIDVGAGSLAGLGGAIQSGSVKPIGLISIGRSSKLVGIQTMAEAGMTGSVFEDLVECNMLLGPAGTPKPVIERLARLVHESVTKSARVMAVRDQLGSNDVPLTGEALQKFIARTWPTYRKLTAELGLQVD